MRGILLTLLNLALPFLLRALYLLWLRWLWQRRQAKNPHKPEVIDITPNGKPAWHFPIVPLLLAGVMLLGATLVLNRCTQENESNWHSASPAVSR